MNIRRQENRCDGDCEQVYRAKELNGRLVDTSKLGKTGERQINTVKELEKLREKERQRKEDKAAKKEKRETERDWQIAKQTMNEGMIQHILQPFENLTGINCVADHAEPDEEEEVSDYEDEDTGGKRAAKGGILKNKKNRDAAENILTGRQRVAMMMSKVQQEELEVSESEEEVEA